MILQYYVIESATGKHINIEVDAASKDDLEITRGRLANRLGHRFYS